MPDDSQSISCRRRSLPPDQETNDEGQGPAGARRAWYLAVAAVVSLGFVLAGPDTGGAAEPGRASPRATIATPEARPVERVRRDLAERLGVGVEKVEVVGSEAVTWPDTCLGLPAPELCAPGETRGYRVTLRLAGREYRYHTNLTSSFRYAGPGASPEHAAEDLRGDESNE